MERTDFQGWILGLVRKTLSENREYFYKITEQADKIIVWLVGFSITSIALSISKSIELNMFLNKITEIIVVFGSLTIITGILYRIFIYIAQSLELKILLEFDTYVEGYNNPPVIHVGREITDINTYDEIVDFLIEDFEKEVDRIDISTFNPEQVSEIRLAALNYYKSLNYWENKQFEEEKNGVKNVLINHLGNSERKVEKAFTNTEPNKLVRKAYWTCLYAARVLFILSCLSFTAGMTVILTKYLLKISG